MKKQITLEYGFDAFEPVIDTLTMETHYGKHHKAYTDNLNAALDSTPELQGRCVKCILKDFDNVPEAVKNTIRNNGGGFVNHNLYFDIISPNPVKEPKNELAEKINAKFGSLDNLKAQLVDLAVKQFGSGWAWLAVDQNNELITLSTPNQDSPLMQGYYPILGVDVWEHAYYLKYRNLRKDHVEAFLNLIDWEKVEKHYNKALNHGTKCEK